MIERIKTAIICFTFITISDAGDYYEYTYINTAAGLDLAWYKSPTVSHCRSLCDGNSECNAFVISPGYCWLKTKEARLFNSYNDRGTHSYTRADQIGYTYSPDMACNVTQFIGQYSENYVYDCSQKCSNDEACLYFVFDKSTSSCLMANQCSASSYTGRNLYTKLGSWGEWAPQWSYTGLANIHTRTRTWNPESYGFTADSQIMNCHAREIGSKVEKNKKISSSYLINSKMAKSKLKCIAYCKTLSNCMSVNMLSTEGQYLCEVNHVRVSDITTALITKSGYRYYEVNINKCE